MCIFVTIFGMSCVMVTAGTGISELYDNPGTIQILYEKVLFLAHFMNEDTEALKGSPTCSRTIDGKKQTKV